MAQVRPVPGTYIRTIDLTGARTIPPAGVPAMAVGTSPRGPAYVPITVGNRQELAAIFGEYSTRDFAAISLSRWLDFQTSATFLRLLGVGKGDARLATGEVEQAGFDLRLPPVYRFTPDDYYTETTDGYNPFAYYDETGGGDPADTDFNGALYFLGTFMKDYVENTVSLKYLEDATWYDPTAPANPAPVLRAAIMVPHGVALRLKNENYPDLVELPAFPVKDTTLFPIDDPATIKGSMIGSLWTKKSEIVKTGTRYVQKVRDVQEFTLLLNGFFSDAYPAFYTVSLDKDSPNYFANVLNTDPTKMFQKGHYLYTWYDISGNYATVNGDPLVTPVVDPYTGESWEDSIYLVLGDSTVDNPVDFETWRDRYRAANSPWVISQKFGGLNKQLFRFHSKDDGQQNLNFKVSIENIVPSSTAENPYGSFNVVIRFFDNMDVGGVSKIETFYGINLNPSSDRYIARVIGDEHTYFDFDVDEPAQRLIRESVYGPGSQGSKYVWVEVDPDVDNQIVDASALPVGYRGPQYLNTYEKVYIPEDEAHLGEIERDGATASYAAALTAIKLSRQIPVPMRKKISIGTGAAAVVGSSLYWGFQLEHPGSVADPNNVGSSLTNANISLESLCKYFPNFWVDTTKNVADADSADADDFGYHKFSLENITVVTKGANYLDNNLPPTPSGDGSDALISNEVDENYIKSWFYVADGVIPITMNGTVPEYYASRAWQTTDLVDVGSRNASKFTFYLYGGFDGTNMFSDINNRFTDFAIAQEMNEVTVSTVGGTPAALLKEDGPVINAHRIALKVVENKIEVMPKLLVVPGIREAVVTDMIAQTTNNRSDLLYIMDPIQLNESNQAVYDDKVYSLDETDDLIARRLNVKNTSDEMVSRDVNSSYVASYFPDQIITHGFLKSTGELDTLEISVPPSVAVVAAYAKNEAQGTPWLVVAGETRGVIPNGVSTRLWAKEENFSDLTNASINVIRRFADKNGLYIWDGKTLLSNNDSSLSRLNVRWMLLELRRRIRNVSQNILFDPNIGSTRTRLQNAIQPTLDEFVKNGALRSAKLEIQVTELDTLNNTLRGKIRIVPTKYIEVIYVDFILSNSGLTI